MHRLKNGHWRGPLSSRNSCKNVVETKMIKTNKKNRSKRNQKLCLAFNCFILGVHGRYRIAYATYSKVGVFCALNSTCFMNFPSSEEFNGPGGRPKEEIGNTKGLGLNSWKPTTQSMDG